jgi:protein-disulfide isomerase
MTPDTEGARLVLSVSEPYHSQGLANAPVTLVEYGDFECPYCGEAYPIVQEVQRRLGERLRFVFRNFPLTQVHPHAEHAAEAAEAAAAQANFWPMHDTIFEHQRHLEDGDLMHYARDLGLDTGAFEAEMAACAHSGRVREDFLSGVRSGVNGTPTFFINGLRHDDAYNLDTLLAAVEHAERTAHAGAEGARGR